MWPSSEGSHPRSKVRSRILDYALYVSVGLAMVALAWFGSQRFLEGPGLPLLIFTPIVFGSAIYQYRGYYKIWQFWCIFCILLGVHFALFIWLARRISFSNTLWILLFVWIELFVVYRLLAWTCSRSTTPIDRERQGLNSIQLPVSVLAILNRLNAKLVAFFGVPHSIVADTESFVALLASKHFHSTRTVFSQAVDRR